jgi:hypothetical protein
MTTAVEKLRAELRECEAAARVVDTDRSSRLRHDRRRRDASAFGEQEINPALLAATVITALLAATPAIAAPPPPPCGWLLVTPIGPASDPGIPVYIRAEAVTAVREGEPFAHLQGGGMARSTLVFMGEASVELPLSVPDLLDQIRAAEDCR